VLAAGRGQRRSPHAPLRPATLRADRGADKTLQTQRHLERLTVTAVDADLPDGGRMLGAVIAGIVLGAVIAGIVGVAIVRRRALRARRQEGEVIRLVDVSVTEAEAVLTEPGVDAHVLGEIVPERPVLDITLCNDGDRIAFVRRMYLELKGPIPAPATDPPDVHPSPGAAIAGPLPAGERQPPSDSYAINFPLQEGYYARMVNQVLAADEVDRFVVSLVAQEETEQGKDFLLPGDPVAGLRHDQRQKAGHVRTHHSPGVPPSRESPDVIKQRLSQIADLMSRSWCGDASGALPHPNGTAGLLCPRQAAAAVARTS
jgi:hypothetical protein